MTNDKVTFAKGNTPLPADIIPGRLIVAEDTGDTYLDTELNKRIQLKDGTKVANVNGQVAGYLDVGGTTPNTMLGDNTGSIIAGSSLKSNSRGSFIGGNGSDIGTEDKRASYILTTGQGNKLNASYTILSGMGLFENAGASVCVGSHSILDSNYSILNVASSYTKMKVNKNTITLIDCTADGFSSANEEASRVELTRDILDSWRTQGKMEQIAQYNRVVFAYGSMNNISGSNNYVYGSYCTTNGQFNKQINSSDSTVSGEFNITRRDNNIVIGDRNEGDSTGQMFEIFGTDSYSSGQGMLVGNHLIDKDGNTPKLVLGQCNAVATTPSYLVVGSGTTANYLTVADIPDNSSKTVGVNGDINVNIVSGYPDLTIVEGNTPTAIPDNSYDKLYKVPTTDTTVYKLMVGFGFGGTGAAHPNYPDWKKYSDWKLIGYVVKELPTVGEDGIIYYQSVDDSNTCIVCFYSNNSWHLNRITNLSSPFRVAVFQDIQRKNSLELHKDDVMQLSQFPEVGQSDAVPSPTKPSQLVNKKYVDEIKQQVGAGFTPQIVESLPTVGDPTILYLVLKEGTAPQGNIYNEYLWIDGAYEHIGDTDTLMTVDNALSATSENPVQNKVIYNALDKKIEEPSGNGLVRKHMNGVYTTAEVDTTMPTSPTDNNIPTTKLLKDYVEDNTSNPLKLSDTNLQKSGLLIQTYTPAGSTPGTVGTRTYSVIERDVSTLDDTNTGRGKVPSSYVVGEYVKESVANKADINNPLSLIEAYRKSNGFLIHDYAPSTGERYVLNPKDGVTLDDTATGKSKIPSSWVVGQYVKESVANKVDKIEGKGLSTNDYTNEERDSLDKLSKKFELVEQFTLTEDVTQIYRNQKPNGEAYNFNDVIMTLSIPIIEQGSTEAYGGTFMYIVNSETDTANNRVVAQGGTFKKGQVSNISVRAKIEGGIVFGTYGASAGNISNKQAAFTSYSNMSMLSAENITSVLFTFFGQTIFSGTIIKIYAR